MDPPGRPSAPALGIDLSGIGVRISGVSPPLADRLRSEWAPFVGRPSEGPFLRVDVRPLQKAPDYVGSGAKGMASRLDPAGARFVTEHGSAEVDAGGMARIRLLRDTPERELLTLGNLLRACLAWSLPGRGGGLLHAAALVLAGRAYVLVGASGSGKTTWSRLGARSGGHVPSDDLVVLDGIGPRFELLGAPFFSRFRSHPVKGRWPLAAILFPQHGAPPQRAACPALAARARIAANLSFVAEALESDPRIAALLERLATSVPCVDLTFAPDPSFVDLLRDWP